MVDLPQQPGTFEITIPPELTGGVYSNVVNVWHTAYEFTLDFAVFEPTREDEAGNRLVPCHVVSRVRVPVTLLFDLLQALNTNMTQYERLFGEIQRPEPKGAQDDESDDLGNGS